MTICLVADSSSDIDPARAKSEGIAIVPLSVTFGDETFLDKVDLTPEEFFTRMAGGALPTTSMPNISQFEETFRQVIRDGATTVISAHVSSTFSGTYNAARIAGQNIAAETGVPIHVLDSGSVSAGIGLPLFRAAALIRQGASPDAVIANIQNDWQHGHIYILLDTLENLERSGRIGRAQALIGSLLNIKPILTFKDGVVTPLERVRTRQKALVRLTEIVQSCAPIAALAIATSDESTQQDFAHLVQAATDVPFERFTFGPVVGTHAGVRSGGVYVITQG